MPSISDQIVVTRGFDWNKDTLAWEAHTISQGAGAQVSVTNWPSSQAVTGTFWQATQPVSIASMPSTPVTGTFWQATQPVSLAEAARADVVKTNAEATYADGDTGKVLTQTTTGWLRTLSAGLVSDSREYLVTV